MSGDPVWINGALGGGVEPSDRGLLLGDGVFDTAVAFRRRLFAAERHLARLVGHADAIGIAVDPARVRAGWDAVIGASKSEHLILRTTVTRGVTARGLWPQSAPAPTLMVSATPWSGSAVARPVRLVTSTILRNPGSPTSRLKAIGYLDNILAAREAVAQKADDAILLNAAGRIACSTIANVFVLYGGRLFTPPVADGVLAGIVRGLVLEMAPASGIEVAERSLEMADLLNADEVFLTNSVRLLSPAQSLDGRVLGGRDAGRLAKLLAALAERVRKECDFDPRGG